MKRKPTIKIAFPNERSWVSADERAAKRQSAQRPVVEGVPLAKLIKRDLDVEPEIVMISQPRSLCAEKFRRLKTTLVNLPGEQPRVIVVSSGVPYEGKTTVSINLALAFATDSKRKTLLIDGDLRRPTLYRIVRPKAQIGLSHILSGRADADHAILSTNESALHILPAGEPCPEPLELLVSANLRDLLTSLRQRYDRIIVDTPPLVPFTDADVFGAYSDGVLMVVRAGKTEVSTYKQALESVTSTRVLGVVLNDLSRGSLADWGKYHGRYAEKYYAPYYARVEGSRADDER